MTLLTPKEKFIAIYNADLAANGKPTLNPDDFEMSVPANYSGPRSTKNTVIYLQPLASSPYIGLATIYYNRINLATISTLRVSKGSATTLGELLPTLNIELGLNFSTADFTTTTLPSGLGTFTLTASAANLAFTGATTVTLD